MEGSVVNEPIVNMGNGKNGIVRKILDTISYIMLIGTFGLVVNLNLAVMQLETKFEGHLELSKELQQQVNEEVSKRPTKSEVLLTVIKLENSIKDWARDTFKEED